MIQTINEQRKITVDDLPSELPVLNACGEPKESVIKKWLMNWILSAINKKTVKENDILPSKSELSEYLGVSKGTVQNAIRSIEDEGIIASKQKKGTIITGMTNPVNHLIKATSKRTKAVLAIKRVIIQKGYEKGETIPSARKMAEFLNLSQNIARSAYEHLSSTGIIEYKKITLNGSNWILKTVPSFSSEEMSLSVDLFPETLVEKITKSMKKYLASDFKPGDKIPSLDEFSQRLGVSVKTVHDCLKELNKQGIVISRRGKYGSILAQDPMNPVFEPLKENSIFAKAQDAAFYSYQKIETRIINLINNNYNAGDKLPSMSELASMFDVSTNTVRKALINLSQDGLVTFGRGRYGGTFVIEKPDFVKSDTYKWLSVNPDYK